MAQVAEHLPGSTKTPVLPKKGEKEEGGGDGGRREGGRGGGD
jgi:hypothetical protein